MSTNSPHGATDVQHKMLTMYSTYKFTFSKDREISQCSMSKILNESQKGKNSFNILTIYVIMSLRNVISTGMPHVLSAEQRKTPEDVLARI